MKEIHAVKMNNVLIFTSCVCSSLKHDGDVWPHDGLKQVQANRELTTDTRHGNVSLIPLRGSENEMRNSVAAFSQDPLAVSEPTNQWDNLGQTRKLERKLLANQTHSCCSGGSDPQP